MIFAAVSAAAVALLAAPHLLRLDGTPPMQAVLVWLAALGLRAVLVVSVTVLGLLVLPSTDAVHLLTHWCWQTLLPLGPGAGVSGHAVADVAMILPLAALMASVLSVALALRRAARAVARLVAAGLSGGPRDSVIVRDDAIVIAAAGLRRPRIVASAGALAILEDRELRAALDHERGHILRRHRWLLVSAEIARALARPLPGTRRAAREVAFHVERDADRYALACANEPLDLVEAICKAAAGATGGRDGALALAGTDASRRVRLLLEPEPAPSPRALRLLVAALAAAAVALVTTLPGASASAAAGAGRDAGGPHCRQ